MAKCLRCNGTRINPYSSRYMVVPCFACQYYRHILKIRKMRGMTMREVNQPAFEYIVRQWKPAEYGNEDELKATFDYVYLREKIEKFQEAILGKGEV